MTNTTDAAALAALCAWLRNNSSGIYRPAAEAADLIERQAARIAELEAAIEARTDDRDAWQERAEFMTAMARDAQDACLTLEMALAEQVPWVYEGLQLVPVAATPEMMAAGEAAFCATARPGVTWAEHTGSIWAAMLNAAPTAPAPKEKP